MESGEWRVESKEWRVESKELKFFITDVFGETKYSGNQLATFLNCQNLSEREMQQIAREINFSESTFVLSDEPNNGGYDVRIFTPEREVDFAGHPTLGTAYIIKKHILAKPANEVILNLKVGQLPVQIAGSAHDGLLWMQQVKPEFGGKLDREQLAIVLHLATDEIAENWPIEEISTGLPFIIVPLKSMGALKKAAVAKAHYNKLVRTTWAKGILVFCPGGYTANQNLAVRVFVDYYGIPEDPATGSGNGCLAAYLVKNRYFQSPAIDICTGQGYEIGRPSQLYLKAIEESGSINIKVGGKVIPVAEGWWESRFNL